MNADWTLVFGGRQRRRNSDSGGDDIQSDNPQGLNSTFSRGTANVKLMFN